MPGSTPAISQLDWLISITAIIVLFWSRATSDLLKSFGWGIAALHRLHAATKLPFPCRPPRRRDFNDDNFETPRRSFGSTPGSSARFEAPSGPPVQAVVKWYNPDKGFGFVQLADGSGDAFLHVSVVERSGHGSVPPGATLEVRAGPGPKGPQVSEILSV